MQNFKKLSFDRIVVFKRSIEFLADSIILARQRYCRLINEIQAIGFNRAYKTKRESSENLRTPFPIIIM